jgi:G:T-mismatch repair DNA endonuclease (very short patch repair protein)
MEKYSLNDIEIAFFNHGCNLYGHPIEWKSKLESTKNKKGAE